MSHDVESAPDSARHHSPVYFDDLEPAPRSICARRILAVAQAEEPPFSREAVRYVVGVLLAMLAALAYDYLSDFSLGFSRPEERTFVGFLAVFVALWGSLGLLSHAANRAANHRVTHEVTTLALPHVLSESAS